MTYLMRQVAAGKNTDPYTPELLAKMTRTAPQQAKFLGECLAIVAAPGVAAFAGWREHASDTPVAAHEQLFSISRLAIFRQRVDLMDVVVDFACDLALDRKSRQSRRQGRGYDILGMIVSNAAGLPAKTRLIDRTARRLLGPPPAWELYAATARNPDVSAIKMRIEAFQQFCNVLLSDMGGSVALARFVAGNHLGDDGLLNLMGLPVLEA